MKQLLIISLTILLSACAQYGQRSLDLGAYPLLYDMSRVETVTAAEGKAQTDLMAQVLKSSPAVLQLQTSVLAARATAHRARIHPVAGLGLTMDYSKAAGGASPWLYGAALDLSADRGQRHDSRVQSADLTALLAYYDYAEAVWTAYSKVNHSLIDRRAADEETQVAAELVLVRSTLVNLTEQRIERDEESELTIVRLKSDLAAAQSLERAASSRRTRADQALAEVLGVTADKVESLKIITDLDDIHIDPTDLMTWRREAVLLRKDVLSAVAAYEQSNLELHLAYAKPYPNVRLGPGYSWEQDVNRLPLSIGLSLSPYDLNHAAITEAEARRGAAARVLESRQAAVMASVDQAWSAFKQAQVNRHQADQIDLPLAQKAFGTAQLRYRFGETDGLDFATAKAALAEATLSAIEARHLASLAQADLEDALRRPFHPQDQKTLQSAIDRLTAKP